METEARLREGQQAALGDAIEALDRARRVTLYAGEARIVELALLVARRIIAQEVRVRPMIVADLVREGLDALDARDHVRVHLGSGFAEAQSTVQDQLKTRGIDLEILVDPGLEPYGCIVETDIGRVDESIESRVAALFEAILSEESA